MSQGKSLLWTDRTTEFQMTGTWRSAVPDYNTLVAPCHTACPVGGEIATWIHQITDKDYHAAWLTLIENNPLPAVIGRICHHPCQSVCNRREMDETVGICSLERFVGDMALAENWQIPMPCDARAETVAVIGGGPAGLSAAYQLLRAGLSVTLYESRAQLGGLLRYGIPAYRLDKRVLDGEIARLFDLGLEVRLGAAIGDAAALGALRDLYDAVYLATGASLPKRLPGLDYDQPYVVDGAEFLAATNSGGDVQIGKRVLVIGGGSAALDAARTARRLWREVTVMSLEPEGQLPAQRAEIIEAQEEGVVFIAQSMLQSLDPSADGIRVNCTRVTFQAGKTRGEFQASRVKDGGFTVHADTIIASIGQDADIARWGNMLAPDGAVAKTDKHWETGTKGLFAGGDLASMERFVSQAIGMGNDAAKEIILVLDKAANKPTPNKPTTNDTGAAFGAINTAYQIRAARNRQANVAPDRRLYSFDEVQQPLDLDAALTEAARCFSCGTCIYCDNCFFYCPDMAITKLDHAYEVKSDYCKGCGLCVAECPTGAVQMIAEAAL